MLLLDLLDATIDWLYEFRIPIICVILLVLMFAFRGCEVRVSIDSRPSQTVQQK